MKDFLLGFLLCAFTFSAYNMHAQKAKVGNATIMLQNGEVLKAKESIDIAMQSDEVKATVRGWEVKGDVYKSIYETKVHFPQNPNALFTADEAYRKAFEIDQLGKGKRKTIISNNLSNVAIYLYNEGLALYKNEDFEKAYSYFDACQSINSFMLENKLTDKIDTNAVLVTAYAASNSKKYDVAKTLYEKLIGMDVDNANVYSFLAEIYNLEGDTDKMVDIVEKGRAKFPDNAALRVSELNYYIKSGKADQAIDKLKEAVENDPTNHTMYFALGSAYDQLGDKENAAITYQKAIDAKPDYYEAYFNLGAIYYNDAVEINKQMNEMTDWKAAQAMEPERNSLYEKALPYFEKAYALNTNDAGIKGALKEIYARMNMMDKLNELK